MHAYRRKAIFCPYCGSLYAGEYEPHPVCTNCKKRFNCAEIIVYSTFEISDYVMQETWPDEYKEKTNG